MVTELSLLGCKLGLDLLGLIMLEAAVLHGDNVVVVLLGKNLAVLDWLHAGVVVVLVNLLVDCGDNLLTLLTLDGLVNHSGSDLLVDGGVVMAGLGHEVFDGCLCGIHCDVGG